jgi:hypothetical protein
MGQEKNREGLIHHRDLIIVIAIPTCRSQKDCVIVLTSNNATISSWVRIISSIQPHKETQQFQPEEISFPR